MIAMMQGRYNIVSIPGLYYAVLGIVTVLTLPSMKTSHVQRERLCLSTWWTIPGSVRRMMGGVLELSMLGVRRTKLLQTDPSPSVPMPRMTWEHVNAQARSS